MEQLPSTDSIRVLLVDDNEQWATFLSEDLEREDETLEVNVALGANEAMIKLQDPGGFDVVVADYRMPEIDGLQLLAKIREDDELMPVILVTAAGSEEIASTAMEAGVTDYLIKNPVTEQTPLLARRIRAAYEGYELRERLRSSEERYRALTEQSREAICIVQEGKLVFANQRFGELVNEAPDPEAERNFVETYIVPDHRERAEELLLTRDHHNTDSDIFSFELLTGENERRTCEITVGEITFSDATAVLLSIRDVTERKLRERRLERERRVNRRLLSVLSERPEPRSLERVVGEELRSHGYDFIWIGTATTDELQPRVSVGESTYLEQIATTDDGPGSGEPAVIATRTGEPQFIEEIRDLMESGWQIAALADDFVGIAAVPIEHDDVSNGVLVAFTRNDGWFNQIERELLTETTTTLAFAIDHLRTQRSLSAEQPVTATVSVPAEGSSLQGVVRDIESKITVLGSHAFREETYLQYLEVPESATETVVSSILAQPDVVSAEPIGEEPSVRFRVVLEEPPVEYVFARRGAKIRETIVQSDEVIVTFDYPDRGELESLFDELADEIPGIQLESLIEVDTAADPTTDRRWLDMGELTEKQRTALEAAAIHGYFEQPRGASATDIADVLGVSHSTFLQHLRAAERKTIEGLLDIRGQ